MPTYKKLANGTWSAWYEGPKTGEGERNKKCLRGFQTKREAAEAVSKKLAEIAAGTYLEPSALTLTSFLADWLEHRSLKSGDRNLSPSSVATYEYLIRVHITPKLGMVKLQQLRPRQLQEFYAALQATGRQRGEGGVSGQTALQIHRLLRTALEQAVKWELLTRNPADLVDAPRARTEEREPLTVAQTLQLLEPAEGTRLHLPILLAITTVMRRGEILGLRWVDTDLSNNFLLIRQAAVSAGKQVVTGPPKTERSKRKVGIPEFVAERLRERRLEAVENATRLEREWSPLEPITLDAAGKPWHPAALTGSFSYLLRRLGLPAVHFHDLRHGHATLLLEQGVDARIVSGQLGHTSTLITQDRYQHVTERTRNEAVEAIEKALGIKPVSEARKEG